MGTLRSSTNSEHTLAPSPRQHPASPHCSLAKLRAAYEKKNGKHNLHKFPQPRSYDNPSGMVCLVSRPPSDGTYDPHVGTSAALYRIKQAMAPWLWLECNNALDSLYLLDELSMNCFMPFREREDPMKTALQVLAPTYPSRPAGRLSSSPSVDELRAVLQRAPCPPPQRHEDFGRDLDGLSLRHSSWPEDETWYEWSEYYLEELFSVLIAVINAHGVGDGGWRAVRWEAYDRVRLPFFAYT